MTGLLQIIATVSAIAILLGLVMYYLPGRSLTFGGGATRGRGRAMLALSNHDVVLPRASWRALLEELTHLGADTIRDEFENVGTTRPVKLTLEQKAELLRMIDHWAHGTHGGLDSLPNGIPYLRNELEQDVQDAEQGQQD